MRRRPPRPPRMSMKEFEGLVSEALDELPESFRRLLDTENVVVLAEDEPSDEDYDLTDTPDDEDLFGVFRGPMRTQTSSFDLPGLPAHVVVFRGPILRNTSSKREAIKEIKDTLVHEVGHFFGLEDEEMPV